MIGRPKDPAKAHVFHRAQRSTPQFSPDFIKEVRECPSIEAFVELMDSRGIWLNRNAAEGVYLYLRSLGDAELSDDDLDGVIGGIHADPLQDMAVQAELAHLSAQLGGLG